MVDSILLELSLYDTDTDFSFNSKYHKYTYKGKNLISVTKFIERFHREFDSNYWSKFKSEETGLPQEQILLDWKKKNERANEIGTATHQWIENYFKGIYQQLPNDLEIIDRINKFNIIHASHLFKLTPIKIEQRIFSKKWKIAGTFDSLFLFNGLIIIIDFKTNGKFTTDDSTFGKSESLLFPFESFYKNHQTEYSIQVSLYSLILKEVGIDVRKGYLLHIGPDSEAKLYPCFDFSKELEQYLDNSDLRF